MVAQCSAREEPSVDRKLYVCINASDAVTDMEYKQGLQQYQQ